jgi:hypothetical protein
MFQNKRVQKLRMEGKPISIYFVVVISHEEEVLLVWDKQDELPYCKMYIW